ncbi:MAG: tetratricopeptide repeat protein, partial [Pirellulaceae bacterium]
QAEFSRLANLESMLRFSASGLLSGSQMSSFARSAGQTESQLFQALAQPGSSYTFIGTKLWDEGQGTMMRFVDSGGACNFHHWYVVKDNDGRLKGLDMYVFMSGENMSETFRRLIYLASDLLEPSVIDRLTGKSKTMVEQGQLMQEFMSTAQAGQHQRTLELYHKLPEELQQEKAVLINRLRASIQVSDNAYRRAIEDYQSAFPNDPSCQLVCIDLYAMNNEMDKANEAIEILQQSVGGDAHMYWLQGALFSSQEKWDEAAVVIRKALDKEPEYEPAYIANVGIQIQLGNFVEAAKTVREMCDRFGYSLDELALESNPEFREFVQSDEYKQLKNDQ